MSRVGVIGWRKGRSCRAGLALLCWLVSTVSVATDAVAPVNSPSDAAGLTIALPTVASRVLPEAFVPMIVPYMGGMDRLQTEFDLLPGEVWRVRRIDFDGDGVPEWLLVPPPRLCPAGVCLTALFDGKSARELGRFNGTVVVYPGEATAYPMIKTISPQDTDFFNLRTYTFIHTQYQVVDDILIGGAERTKLLDSVAILY